VTQRIGSAASGTASVHTPATKFGPYTHIRLVACSLASPSYRLTGLIGEGVTLRVTSIRPWGMDRSPQAPYLRSEPVRCLHRKALGGGAVGPPFWRAQPTSLPRAQVSQQHRRLLSDEPAVVGREGGRPLGTRWTESIPNGLATSSPECSRQGMALGAQVQPASTTGLRPQPFSSALKGVSLLWGFMVDPRRRIRDAISVRS